jgi:tRNA A37 threonylcarbamoyladenosine dehydratase
LICTVNPGDDRFGGIERLYGAAGAARLRAARVCVVGIGGVGSWTVEALARSGLGALTLVDLDDVCVSNVNRQIHALEETLGQAKVEVMAARVRQISPQCRVDARLEFFNAVTAEALFAERFDAVVDAIDNAANKARLLGGCRARGIPVIACGAAGGRRDGLALRLADLAHVTHDRLLAEVRKQLRREHGFPREGELFGVPCVYSPEPPVVPSAEEENDATGCASAAPPEAPRLNCNSGLGSATFVTGAFGFAAAGWVVAQITGMPPCPNG